MESTQLNTVLAGCAGSSIPCPLSNRVPVSGSRPEWYAKLFGAAEINSWFVPSTAPCHDLRALRCQPIGEISIVRQAAQAPQTHAEIERDRLATDHSLCVKARDG
jgi:hypothetical protein